MSRVVRIVRIVIGKLLQERPSLPSEIYLACTVQPTALTHQDFVEESFDEYQHYV